VRGEGMRALRRDRCGQGRRLGGGLGHAVLIWLRIEPYIGVNVADYQMRFARPIV
jgi:hypothetical protein